jgi:hypothetical protein
MGMAWVYVKAGEIEKAIDQFEFLLTIPSYLSTRSFEIKPRHISPAEEKLWAHPRFQALAKAGQLVL